MECITQNLTDPLDREILLASKKTQLEQPLNEQDVNEGPQRKGQTLAVVIDSEDKQQGPVTLLMDLLVRYQVWLSPIQGTVKQCSWTEQWPCSFENGALLLVS